MKSILRVGGRAGEIIRVRRVSMRDCGHVHAGCGLLDYAWIRRRDAIRCAWIYTLGVYCCPMQNNAVANMKARVILHRGASAV